MLVPHAFRLVSFVFLRKIVGLVWFRLVSYLVVVAERFVLLRFFASCRHRYVYNEVNNRFPSLPFSLRALEDEKQVSVDAAVARMLLNIAWWSRLSVPGRGA